MPRRVRSLLFHLAPAARARQVTVAAAAAAAGGGAADPHGDVRRDAFVYAYFYGLCVHKLAHFFDVVHGTRHDFFMSEYRAHHAANWVALLCELGFDPARVAREHPALLWNVVN